jgi:hypothetical protein
VLLRLSRAVSLLGREGAWSGHTTVGLESEITLDSKQHEPITAKEINAGSELLSVLFASAIFRGYYASREVEDLVLRH